MDFIVESRNQSFMFILLPCSLDRKYQNATFWFQNEMISKA